MHFVLLLVTVMMLFAVDDGFNDGGFNNDDDGMVMGFKVFDEMIFYANQKSCGSIDFF